jgi:hypothetical protein
LLDHWIDRERLGRSAQLDPSRIHHDAPAGQFERGADILFDQQQRQTFGHDLP